MTSPSKVVTLTTTPKRRTPPPPRNWNDCEEMKETVDRLTAAVQSLDGNMAILAESATSTLSFIKKAIPWAVAAIGVAWPAMQKIIGELPVFPG